MTNPLPNIFIFNPTCDFAIANGSPNWQPNRLLQKMEDDLSGLPLFLARKNDIVLVNKVPSDGFIHSLEFLNIEIPGFIQKNESTSNQQFLELPKNKLVPWGWSPAAHRFFDPLKKSCSDEFKQSPVFNWEPPHREIASRKFAIGILKKLQTSLSDNFVLPAEQTPKICTTPDDFEDAIHYWGQIMVKAPWSSSGRGLQPITKTPVHPKVWEKVAAIVTEQGYAIAEPFLNKVLDMAFLFEMKKGKVSFSGTSYFFTNKKGQYNGNFLNGLPETTDKNLISFIGNISPHIIGQLIDAVEASKMAFFYDGVFGVDTLIYKDQNNLLKINPCLEINVRHTMGFISLQLEKIVHPAKKGQFLIFYQPGTSFKSFKNRMENLYPVKIIENKIFSGFLALTDATGDNMFGAYILV